MRTIVAFGHRKRVGKDLCSDLLVSYLIGAGITARKSAFADKLKDVCHQLYGWAGLEDAAYYDKFPEERERVLPAIGKSPRQVWIDLGTPAIREQVYDRTWVDYLLQSHTEGVLVISDMRFPNEAEAVREAGGMLVKVDRPSVPHTDDVADLALEGFEGWDMVIENDDSASGLISQLKQVQRRLMGGIVAA